MKDDVIPKSRKVMYLHVMSLYTESANDQDISCKLKSVLNLVILQLQYYI